MANLKAAAQKIDAEVGEKLARSRVTLPLPIYAGRYAGRFAPLEQDTLGEVGELANLAADGGSLSPEDERKAMETLALAVFDSCRVILARTSKDGGWERLEHDDGRPVRFDADLAEVLELEVPEGYELDSAGVVIACWSTKDEDTGKVSLNESALGTFATGLISWTNDTTKPVEDEIVEGPHGGPKSSG
jgi:hypothetical protein